MSAVLLAGCGGARAGAQPYDAAVVKRAFATQGFALQPLAANGAEQPAMGVTSSCESRYRADGEHGSVVVFVCEDERAARGTVVISGLHRRNVLVLLSGENPVLRRRALRALAALD